MHRIKFLLAICVVGGLLNVQPSISAERTPLRLLFLGDNGHHRPADRAAQLIPVLRERGIEVRYTEDANDLNLGTLAKFDGLIIYANTERITPEQEQALLDYVASGKGFIPIHCASYCFLNSPKYIELVGARFQKHGGEVFSTVIAEPNHPIMRGFGGFRSWDETYVHHKHNEKDRTVLEYRVQGTQADGRDREPWSWVRTHGKGRVFYTAWGHDQRTWGHPGFQNLIERGIRWACGDDPSVVPPYERVAGAGASSRSPGSTGSGISKTGASQSLQPRPPEFNVPEMTAKRTDVQPFEYVDVGAKIPNYTPGAKWGTQGEPLTKMQKPLPPEESLKHYVTPIGFEMRLFASEPDLGGKPIAMNWDDRGRLWVCETIDYPNELQPPGQGRDRIRICEDTDGDGRADRFTVFAEKLSIPTAITCFRGGAIVQNGTETLFLKDTDGDDRADVRKVLISNWALGDTHGGVSNFQYGLDNWIWAMQGYNQSEPVIDGQRQQGFRMGFFRFRLSECEEGGQECLPHVTELEFLRSTDNNTWGLGFSEEGIVFGSTANHNPSDYLPIPNRYYERVRGWAPRQLKTIADTHLFKPITSKVRQVDHHGGYTAAAGHALYTARNYPPQWWNKTAFVCGPTGHLVGTFLLQRDGADFHSTSPCNLVASDDEWAAPIMAEVGPDGNVWILDWYNYIVQHNPTPQGFKTGKGNAYESDLRDKKHGRIYRLVYNNSKPTDRGPWASPDQLVQALTHPTMLQRKQAQRLLVERGKTDVAPALIALVNDPSVDAIGLNVGAIHALWTLHGLGLLDGSNGEAMSAAVKALGHPSAGVRRNAAMVLPSSENSVRALLESKALQDGDAQVRLAALLALSDMPASDSAGQALAALARDPQVVQDRWLVDALTSAAAMHGQSFLRSLLTAKEPKPWAPGILEAVGIVSEHLARQRPRSEDVQALIAPLEAAEPRLATAIIGGWARGWPKDHPVALSLESEASLVRVLTRLPSGSRGELLRLANVWGSRELEKHSAQVVEGLLTTIRDNRAPVKDRIAAVRDLIRFRANDPESVTTLLDLVTPQMPPELASRWIEALTDSTAPNVGEELVNRAASLTPTARGAAIRVLLARPQTTLEFLSGVREGKLTLVDLTLDQKQALANHPDPRIRRRATDLMREGGGLPDPDREKVLQALLPLTEREGNVAAGKETFKKFCMKCHRHSGEGENIGPDLTGMAVHPKAELLTQIIDPSRSVEGNFRVYTVQTADGRVFNGMLAGESRTTIELVDTEAKRHTIQREDIEELISSRKSLMPEGFEKQLAPDDFVNLLEFLTNKGRFVPISLARVATAVSTKPLFHDGPNGPDQLIFDDWGPKLFEGVPFLLTDPRGQSVPNIILLNGPRGTLPPRMPKSVRLPCNTPAVAIHLLSGVGGWNYPAERRKSVSMIVRLHYQDGTTEDHPLLNGVHFADYIRRVDVPESKFAFPLRGRQIRYLAVQPKRKDTIREIELLKGDDPTAPIVMAVTVERPS